MKATPLTPDETRSYMLRSKLERTIRNVSEWWGIKPDQAAKVLDTLRDELNRAGRIGTEPWPDPCRARYNPGTPDAELRELAYQGAMALAAAGTRPSARNVWCWCKARGVRKRQAMALRIVGSVVATLSAREVAASYVRRDK